MWLPWVRVPFAGRGPSPFSSNLPADRQPCQLLPALTCCRIAHLALCMAGSTQKVHAAASPEAVAVKGCARSVTTSGLPCSVSLHVVLWIHYAYTCSPRLCQHMHLPIPDHSALVATLCKSLLPRSAARLLSDFSTPAHPARDEVPNHPDPAPGAAQRHPSPGRVSRVLGAKRGRMRAAAALPAVTMPAAAGLSCAEGGKACRLELASASLVSHFQSCQKRAATHSSLRLLAPAALAALPRALILLQGVPRYGRRQGTPFHAAMPSLARFGSASSPLRPLPAIYELFVRVAAFRAIFVDAPNHVGRCHSGPIVVQQQTQVEFCVQDPTYVHSWCHAPPGRGALSGYSPALLPCPYCSWIGWARHRQTTFRRLTCFGSDCNPRKASASPQ